MSTYLKICLATIIGMSLMVAGCGGNTTELGGTTRGEGTIPIGKITSRPVLPVKIMATCQNGTTSTGTVTSDGTIYMAALPYGETYLSVTPTDAAYSPATYTIDVKAQQRYIINVVVQKVDPTVTVESLDVEIPNAKEMQVGKTYPIKVTVNGKNASSLKPTVWVDSGAGSIDTGYRFLALVTGAGSIHAKIGDVETVVPIIVN